MILSKENKTKVDLDLLIEDKISNNKINELLLIVPTNRKARSLKKEIISRVPYKSAAGINIETLGTVSSKLLNGLKPYKDLSEAASTVFIKQSVEVIKPRYFSIYNGDVPFGTLDRIKNVISEYKRHGISPQRLREEAEILEKSEKLKALDIADIYECYVSKCMKLNIYELGDVYSQLNNLPANEFIDSFNSYFQNVEVIIITGFDEFSQPEIEIIDRLSSIKNIKSYINFDYNKKNKFLFGHIDVCYERLEKKSFLKLPVKSSISKNEFIEILENKLFNCRKQIRKDYTGKIFKISAQNREEEIELISREIKTLITDYGVEPHNICVAFNNVQNYSALVRDIFTKNGIPINLSDRITLDSSFPVTAILNFLEISESDFYYQNVFRAVNSGFIDLSQINFSNLYKVASELKIVSGKERWINSIKDVLTSTQLSIDYDEEVMNQKIISYQKALSDIQYIIDILKPFEGSNTINQFVEKLFNLISSSQIASLILNIGDDKEKNIRGFANFIDTIIEIFELLKEEYGENKTFGLKFFIDQIRTMCGWARFNVKEKSNCGVLVTSLNEIRGLRFNCIFIGGLCDGDLPTRYKPEIFFSGSFKKKAVIHQMEERNLFYQAMKCWNSRVYLTYPLYENGRELVTSSYINDFELLFEISNLSNKEYDNTIYSKEEYQVAIGRKIINAKDQKKNISGIKSYNIEKAVLIEQLREESIFNESIYNGILFDNIENDKTDKEMVKYLESFQGKQYSISQLETYSKCPFKYFLERILNIQTIEEPTEDVEAIEMGNILHNVFYEFYTEIRNRGIDVKKCSNKVFNELHELIISIAEKNITKTIIKSPVTFYEREKLLGLAGNAGESILSKFLEEERNDQTNYKPEYFEVSFGKLKKDCSDERLSTQETIQINNVMLRGKIDRIDVSEPDLSFNIVDYKLSGKKPEPKELVIGISLQLPVYLYAARELLMKKYKKDYQPNDMIIYSLKYSKDDFGKNPVSLKRARSVKINSNEELIELTIAHIKNFISLISQGKFNLSPHENREKIVCGYCQLKAICRIADS